MPPTCKHTLWCSFTIFIVLTILGVCISNGDDKVKDIRGYVIEEDAALAKRLKITPEELKVLRSRQALTNSEIIKMSENPRRLQRSLQRSRVVDLPAKRAAFRRLQQVDEKGDIPADALSRAIHQMELLRLEPGVRFGDWRVNPQRLMTPSIGERDKEWKWIGPANIGGRTRSIVIHPAMPNKMWAGSVSGGIWMTTTAGTGPTSNDQ